MPAPSVQKLAGTGQPRVYQSVAATLTEEDK